MTANGIYIFLGVFGGYVGSSVLLFLFPTILHKKKNPTLFHHKKKKFQTAHISHRGGAGERLENTMSAFRNAVEHHTDMLEIDVQLTNDGEVVVSHDDNLSRVTGHNVRISNCNYEDIPPLTSTLEVTFARVGTVVTRENDDRKIPLLRYVLEEFPDIALNIDTKGNDEVIDKTIELIREFKREHNIVMANLRKEGIDIINEKAPDLMIGFSVKRTAIVVLSFYLGLLPFLPLKESFFEIFLPSVLKHSHPQLKNWHLKLIQMLLIRPTLFRHLQRRGIQVYLFVINEEDDFDLCINKLDVDGVMTDYPTKLETFLNNKNNCF